MGYRVRVGWNDRRAALPPLVHLIGNARSGVCYYCKRRKVRGELSADHRVPVARGGLDEPDNLVVACRDCNRDKGNMTEAEYDALRAARRRWDGR